MKFFMNWPIPHFRMVRKLMIIMKLTWILLLAGMLQVSASVYSQSVKFSFNLKNQKVIDVLNEIETNSEFRFFYQNEQLDLNRRITVQTQNASVEKILTDIFEGTDISYSIKEEKLILLVKENRVNSNKSESQQDKKISGKVTDESGSPLPGVTVIVKGTTQGTVTGNDGNYSLSNISKDATLVFSFVGMRTQEVEIGSQTSINVRLQEETIGIEEVVAIAYGSQKKREITGAVSSVNAEDMKDMPVMNVGQRMQGKFAGVQVSQTNGEPGRGISFRIRGQASINAGNSPLVVIDGFPTLTGIESISPNEIESISVLKDASATSLYGSRAANGVILITTKQAKSGQSEIQFSSNVGLDVVPQRGRPDLMNAKEFAQFKKEYYEDAAKYEGYTGGVPEQYQNPELYQNGTDWFDVLLRNALTQNYNLSLSSGISKFKSAVNLNYNKQEGVILNTYSERFNARANNIYDASENLRFGLNLGVIYQKSQITPGLSNGRNIIGSAFLMDPSLKYKNDDGTYPISFHAPGMFANPNYYLVLTQRINPTKQLNVLSNIFGEYEFIEGLKYKISASTDLRSTINRTFEPSTARGGMFSAPPLPPIGSYNTGNHLSWLLDNTLSYSQTFGMHNIDLLAGYNAQKSTYENSSINASQYPDDEIEWINVATTRVGNAGTSAWTMLSYIGRINYNFDSKYLLSVAFRRDGASRFGSNAKWANFPSVSAGWVISDEDFMDKYSNISWLKFRASYGITGNNNIGNYSYLANVGTVNYVFNDAVEPGRALSSMGNADLTWEQTNQFDIGFDLGLFKDRIYLMYDYYSKNTDGLLYAIDIPTQSGFSNIQSNIGQFDFWGHEISLESHILTGEFKWNANLNISFDRNKAIKLGTNDTPIGGYANQGDENRTMVGQPLGLFWGYVFDGVYMTQEELDSQPKHYSSMIGTARMKDVSGPDGLPDGIIDMNDMTVIGDPNPDFIYGITNEFRYRNFDATIVFSGSYGNDVLNRVLEWTENIDGVFNMTKEIAERWRSPENPGNGNIPRTRSGTTELFRYNNSRWIEDASYIMAKNITLGYTLPMNEIEQIKSARLFISLQNAFFVSKYSGMNPEVSRNGLSGLRQGVDETFYPVPRTYSIGLNINL
uniref:TonB-dependent receptor n=1 Tax=uncultured Draconibacterium sp. TaxID=1573823 RepID=UPI003216F868